MLSGRKVCATNGTIADIAVVMAKVPKGDGHRGGISAFVVPYDTESITIEHRNAFMGLRGIENSVTRLNRVFVPEENRTAREGYGLRIALSTLNTGQLALMAIAVGAAKWSTKIAREWATERVQWGRPIGKHNAVAQNVAFIAGSAFRPEAMLDVPGRLADNKANDVRIEAALCKLYGSELAWRVIDELVQLRGGRGYETAASLKARGEKPVPVEQTMRDMRVNRIFEGFSERRPGCSTRTGYRSGRAARARTLAPTTSSVFSLPTCATSSAPRASSRARFSTAWPAGRQSSSRSSRSSPAGQAPRRESALSRAVVQ